MKSLKLNPTHELASTVQQLRSLRSNIVVEELGIEVEINHTKLKVINISETGASVQGDLGDSTMTTLPVRITIGGTKELYMGGARCAWQNGSGPDAICGIAFTSRFLAKDLIKSMEKVNFLYQKMEEGDNYFSELPEKFKVFVVDFKKYLNELKKCLDAMEDDLQIESPETKKSCETAIQLTIEEKVLKRIQGFNLQLNDLLVLFDDKNLRNNAIAYFRSELTPYLTKAPFTKRALTKPLGYAGDHEMMSQIYRDEYEGATLFDKLIHKYAVNEFSSNSVRFRRKFIKSIILRQLEEQENLSVASIACGPAAEIIDVARSLSEENARKLSVVLIDQDLEALLNAKRGITEICIERSLPLKIEYLPLAVKDALEGVPIRSRLAKQFDLIYSTGLYDYLTQSTAKMLTMILLDYLKPGGKLLIGNFHPKNPTKAISEFAVDWKLVHRSEAEMMDLVSDTLVAKKNLLTDDQQIEIFLEIIK